MSEQTFSDVALLPDAVTLFNPEILSPTIFQRPTLRPVFHGAIPEFPATKPLMLSDQFTVDHWVRQFPPVSDFNFVSLWSWNTGGEDGGIELSWLNDNLVVLFKDYLSNDRFYSFLGVNEVADTARVLLDAAERQGLERRLDLLPGVVILALSPGQRQFAIQIDESQKDYVISTDEWSTLAGGKFRKKRNAIHHLERTLSPVCRPLDAGRSEHQQLMHSVFGQWVVQANRAGDDDVVLQATALQRVFSLDRPSDLLSFGVFIDGDLRAFTINEVLHDSYALGHFCYGDHDIPGLYSYVLRETCRVLHAMGYRFLNTMQDLGQPGMMQAKARSRPHHFFHKYSLTLPADTQQLSSSPIRDEVIQVIFEPLAARH